MHEMTVFSAMRSAALIPRTKQQLQTVQSRGGWWPLVRESFTGAWQQNTEVVLTDVLTYAAVFACIKRISSDIGKLRIKLTKHEGGDIWTETKSPAFSPVLRKPNGYQTSITFLESWLISKLIHGATFVLKQRDNRNVVTALYILDPQRVTVLQAPNGAVYYDLKRDDLSQQPDEQLIAPATEIIHDIFTWLYHPLIGVSPISACGLAAMQGLKIQDNSSTFFENGSQPGGFLTAPGAISDATAVRLKAYWDSNFSGANRGKVAVGGDGLKYEPLGMVNARDALLIDQLKWTAENVCTAFEVPAYMIGVGSAPPYNNMLPVKEQYYGQCLQSHIEKIERLLDEGLSLPEGLQTELDIDAFLRMDMPTRVTVARDAVGSGSVSPNEARRRWLDLSPVEGGETPYLQEQNWPLRLLAARELPARPPTQPEPLPDTEPSAEKFASALHQKAIEAGLYGNAA